MRVKVEILHSRHVFNSFDLKQLPGSYWVFFGLLLQLNKFYFRSINDTDLWSGTLWIFGWTVEFATFVYNILCWTINLRICWVILIHQVDHRYITSYYFASHWLLEGTHKVHTKRRRRPLTFLSLPLPVILKYLNKLTFHPVHSAASRKV